jgi:hypothetical protein
METVSLFHFPTRRILFCTVGLKKKPLIFCEEYSEGIVELMGNTSGQRGDGLHFLGLFALGLQFETLFLRAFAPRIVADIVKAL